MQVHLRVEAFLIVTLVARSRTFAVLAVPLFAVAGESGYDLEGPADLALPGIGLLAQIGAWIRPEMNARSR